ncbi:hypothetical protein MA16_Dca007755 [Dendrobium catenatum]|uniref:Defensin-like protein n=1 Tax=Dendrobium catenatum TaxID=906689 RepID=A0A2I0X586_9ASPA|nr:hypothetical protein MA16_Dca007755 [Dendrobium catenatum]
MELSRKMVAALLLLVVLLPAFGIMQKATAKRTDAEKYACGTTRTLQGCTEESCASVCARSPFKPSKCISDDQCKCGC